MIRSHSRRVALPALAAAAVAAVGACSEINTPQAPAVGTYDLVFVNGDTLPAGGWVVDNEEVEVLEGTIVARSDQSCEFRHTFRMRDADEADATPRVESEVEACTWRLFDVFFNVSFANGGSMSGQFYQQDLWFDHSTPEGTPLRFIYERRR